VSSLHSRAWIAWLAAAIITLSLSRNPVYLLLILLCIAVVSRVLRSQAGTPALPLPLLRLSLVIITLSALFNFVTAHFGQTVLFILPAGIPLLGGPYTLEALAFGMVNGLVLVGFLAAFNVLYQALPTPALIHMIPRALYPIAVVVSIAITFVPTTLAQFQQIREAQMMRGHRVRGLRDWLPLLMPLLVGGLERAFQLAEAMTARGFGSLGVSERAGLDPLRVALVGGLTTLLAGLLVLLLWQQEVAGWALVALGGGALLMALHRQGQRVRRTVYRRQRWTRSDGLVIATAALTVVVYLLPASRGSLAWSPYPQVAWPGVAPAVFLATLGLLTPAALLAWPWTGALRRRPGASGL
jgi:energy-coupling factor transport system permease protein